MLRLALSLLSSLQIGARVKASVERSLRQAIVIAVAVVVLIAAAAFGLVAAYHALISVWEFTPLASAGIVAGALLLLGVLILATHSMWGPRPKETASVLTSPAESMAVVDQGVGKAMQQVGPLTLLVIAFAAGLLASRRR